MVGAEVSAGLVCAGRSVIDLINPMASSAQPRTSRAVLIRRARPGLSVRLTRGRSETLITHRAWVGCRQDRVLYQIAGECRNTGARGEHRFEPIRVCRADGYHALGKVR